MEEEKKEEDLETQPESETSRLDSAGVGRDMFASALTKGSAELEVLQTVVGAGLQGPPVVAAGITAAQAEARAQGSEQRARRGASSKWGVRGLVAALRKDMHAAAASAAAAGAAAATERAAADCSTLILAVRAADAAAAGLGGRRVRADASGVGCGKARRRRAAPYCLRWPGLSLQRGAGGGA